MNAEDKKDFEFARSLGAYMQLSAKERLAAV